MKPNLLARSVLAACLSLNICVQSVSSAFALDAEGPIDGQNNGDGYDPNPTQGGPRYTGKHLAAPNIFKCTHNSFWLYGFMQWNDRDENGFPHYRQWIQSSELKPPPLKNDSHTYFLGVNTGDHVRNYRYMKSQQNMGPIGPEDIVKSTIARFDSIGLETRAGGLVWAPGGNNHLQGLTRYGDWGVGGNFVVFSGGDWHDRELPDDKNGSHLFFAHMGSRHPYIEYSFTDQRQSEIGSSRSNGVVVQVGGSNITVPDSRDKVFKTIRLDWFDRNRLTSPQRPTYWHAGGMQEYQGILAVPLESTDTYFNSSLKYGKVVFIDVTNPWNPTPIEGLEIPVNTQLGAVALTRDVNNRWLVALWRDKEIQLYRSWTVDIRSGFENLMIRAREDGLGSARLPANGSIDNSPGTYQTINFINSCDGTYYLVGVNKTLYGFGDDWLDIYKIEFRTSPFEEMGYNFKKVFKKHFYLDSNVSSFAMANGLFVDRGGVMKLYSSDGYRKTTSAGHSWFEFREYTPQW